MVKDKDINKHYFMYKYFASARLSFVANSRSIMLCELVFPSPTLHTTFSHSLRTLSTTEFQSP